MAGTTVSGRPGRTCALTDRETQVMDELVTGASDSQIAARLYVSVSTVKVHLAHVRDRLPGGAPRGRTALAVWWTHHRYSPLAEAATAVAAASPEHLRARVRDLRRVLVKTKAVHARQVAP